MSFWRDWLSVWRRHAFVRLAVTNISIGFTVSGAAIVLLLWLDPGHIATLLRRTPAAIALLWFFLGLTFASVQMGMAIMDLKSRDDDF